MSTEGIFIGILQMPLEEQEMTHYERRGEKGSLPSSRQGGAGGEGLNLHK